MLATKTIQDIVAHVAVRRSAEVFLPPLLTDKNKQTKTSKAKENKERKTGIKGARVSWDLDRASPKPYKIDLENVSYSVLKTNNNKMALKGLYLFKELFQEMNSNITSLIVFFIEESEAGSLTVAIKINSVHSRFVNFHLPCLDLENQ